MVWYGYGNCTGEWKNLIGQIEDRAVAVYTWIVETGVGVMGIRMGGGGLCDASDKEKLVGSQALVAK